MNRSKSVIKNMIWEMGYYIVVILLGFLAPRYIILYYSSEVNGLSSTITQILNIILLLQAGATSAAIYSLYKPISNNNYDEISRNTAYAENFFKRIAWIFGGIMFVVAALSPVCLKTGIDKRYVFIAFLIMGLKSFVDLYYTAKFRIVFTAFQEKFYISIGTMLEQIVYYIFVFITIFFRWHFLWMYVWFLLGCLVKVAFLDFAFKRRHSNIVTHEYKKEKGKIGGRNYALANEVAHSVVSSSITIILSFTYGLKESSVYSVYALVSQALNLIVMSLYSSFAPSFGNLIAQEDEKKSSSVFSIFQYVYVMLNTFLMMCMLFLVVPFVRIYTTGVTDINYIDFGLATMLALNGLFSAYRIPYNILVSTYGFFKETWKQPVICAFISIVISIFLGKISYWMIIVGPVIFYFLNFFYQYFKLKQMIPWMIDSKIFSLLLISLVGIFGVMVINCIFVVPEGIISWIVYAVIFSMISILYIAVASRLFAKSELISLVQYIKTLNK